LIEIKPKADMKFPRFDPPPMRFWVLMLLYGAELTASLWLAYELRFDFLVETKFQAERLFVLLWLVPLQLLLLGLFHQLSTLLGYFSTPDLARMFHALTIGSLIALIVWFAAGEGFAPPRGVIVLDFVFCLVGLTGVRLALRTFRESLSASQKKSSRRRHRVGIIGAGDAGAVLAHELSLKPGYGLDPVAFFDDDRGKWHSRVHDIPVVGLPETLLQPSSRLDIDEVIIAMPSAPAKRVGEIVRMLRQAQMPCKTVPSVGQLALGQVRVSQLRNIEVQDLLGRDRVELDEADIRQALRGRVVLVTGAGGSIGSELCRQIAVCQPRQLLLLDRSEPQLFLIEQELIGLGHRERVVPLVGDILDLQRMEQIFSEFEPELVFHAAAHKHVPMMERQPAEAIKNNSFGTAQLADLALKHDVERFVLISSDKAINPTSVMGATKRLAEMYLQALHSLNPQRTKFMAVRFGNVLGSSGSVIPLFQRQIAEGGPVKVTHPEMTRYFMTIPEACMLVLQSALQGLGGEIFILDMGKPIKILDLARQMIELSGLKPEVDIQIEFIGVRPGEKLFEELSHKAENVVATRHPKILRLIASPPNLGQIRQELRRLRPESLGSEPRDIKVMLKAAVPEYTPWFEPRPENLPAIANLEDHRVVQRAH
jgi:FlaA1/EpsC-like NDP-sugar epimerase